MPINSDPVRGTAINFIEVLKTPNYMLSFGTPELIYLDKPAGPIDNDKKVYFLAIAEDFLGKIGTDPVHRLQVTDEYSRA